MVLIVFTGKNGRVKGENRTVLSNPNRAQIREVRALCDAAQEMVRLQGIARRSWARRYCNLEASKPEAERGNG
jgi:hypothetical protein